MLVAVDRVCKAQLFPHSLKEPTRHAATEDVGQDCKGKTAWVAERESVGPEYDVGLCGVPMFDAVPPDDCRSGRDAGTRLLPGAALEPSLTLEERKQRSLV